MTISRTKAAFRALRDLCGMTQQDVACELHVSRDDVQKWEKPSAYQTAPDEAWEALEDIRSAQLAQQDRVIEAVEGAMRETGELPEAIDMPYFRTQRDYDEYGRGGVGLYKLANRVAGETAEALVEMGVGVRMFYPDDGESPARI